MCWWTTKVDVDMDLGAPHTDRTSFSGSSLWTRYAWGFDGFVLCRDCWSRYCGGLALTPGVTVLILFYYYVYGGAGCLQSCHTHPSPLPPPTPVVGHFIMNLFLWPGSWRAALVISCGLLRQRHLAAVAGVTNDIARHFSGPKANEATARSLPMAQTTNQPTNPPPPSLDASDFRASWTRANSIEK